MKKLLLLIGIVFFTSLSAMAQEVSKVDAFIGYSYVRAPEELNLNGFNASVTGNLNNYLSFVADFGGTYNSGESLTTFLFGPQVSLRTANSRVTPFARALFGAARTDIRRIPNEKTGFGTAIGGGLDIKLTDRISLRAIQGEYLLARFEGDNRSHTRISTGLVFHFGKK
ncbi:MAG: hypothetical protein JNN15_19455 [Blastocatellia bacterium]|nr:hypothetical protein [Blastocatellia bacterium]